MKLFPILLAIVAMAHDPLDVCTRYDPSSFCLDDGMCSGESGLTCDEAYMYISQNLVRPALPDAEPPITPSLSVSQLANVHDMLTKHLDFNKKPIPDKFLHNDPIRSFMNKISDMEVRLNTGYHFITADPGSLNELISDCQRVVASLTTYNDMWEFRRYFVTYASTTHIYFSMVVRWIYSMDRFDITRKPLFNNLVVYMQAWMRVHELLLLPPPFAT